MQYNLWQPSSEDNEYLFFLIGEVAAAFVVAALGVQDCLLRKYIQFIDLQ